MLSPCAGQIAHALLTRPPLECSEASSLPSPLDLHVLGTPPAFVLSQDQTLIFDSIAQLSLCVSLVRIGINFALALICSHRLTLSCLVFSFSYVSFSRFVPPPAARSFLSLADSLYIIAYPLPSVNRVFRSFWRKIETFLSSRTFPCISIVHSIRFCKFCIHMYRSFGISCGFPP